MRVCFFTTDFPPTVGGISEFSRSIAYHMAESQDVARVHVVALLNRESGTETPNTKLTIIRDSRKSFISIVWNIFRYALRFRGYDVFHATSVFPVGFLTVLIGRYIFRKPVFVTFYGTDVLATLGSKKTKWAKVWTLKHATKALAFSYSTRDEAAQRHSMPVERFEVVYYPLSDEPPVISPETVESLRKKYGIASDDFVVLFVGHLVRRKGPEDLVEALSLIKDEKVKLLFVGAGPMEAELRSRSESHGLGTRVIFAGAQDAKPLYPLAGVFSMPSFFYKEEGDIEGLGIVFLEAQQYGVPVLGTRSGGIPEALEDGGSGFLVPERDVQGLAEKIELLARDKELRRKMGERGRVFVREKFDWRKSVKRHLILYTSAASNVKQ